MKPTFHTGLEFMVRIHTLAQLSNVPTSGASKATDFQPTTENPQTPPGGLVQQQGNLQGVKSAQELLEVQKTSQIQVTKNPADPLPEKPASSSFVSQAGWLLLLIVAAVLLFRFISRLPKQKPAPVKEKASKETKAPKAMAKKAEEKPVTTTKPKTKSTKKKKARRR